MKVLVATGFATALAAMIPVAVRAQAGDPAAGRAYAAAACPACHKVTPDQAPPPHAAASFRAIANTRGVTETSLHAFLSTPHPRMPNLILSQKQQDDVIAYILSLRDRR